MIVLVDMDGVLVDLVAGVHALSGMPRREVTSYGFDPYTNEEKGRIFEAMETRGFFLNLPDVPHAVSTLLHIETTLPYFARLYLCTTPVDTPWCVAEKYAWVREHMGPSWARRIIFTPDKTLVRGDILIDDHPALAGVVEEPSWTQWIFDRPYNQDVRHLQRTTWEMLPLQLAAYAAKEQEYTAFTARPGGEHG